MPARIIEHPAAERLLNEALAERLRPCTPQEFLEAFADAFALHGVPAHWARMLPVYRKILAYPRDILESSILKALGHVKWFPKPAEINIWAEPMLEERRGKHRLPSMYDIDKAVCEAFGLSLAEMVTHRRGKPIALARHVAIYLCRQLTGKTLPQIGRDHGDRDHSSVLHACRVVSARIREDRELAEKVEAITRSLLRQRDDRPL